MHCHALDLALERHRLTDMRLRTGSAVEETQVAADLYAEDAERQRQGVRRVRTWQTRGRVPHAVDATTVLREALLQSTGDDT